MRFVRQVLGSSRSREEELLEASVRSLLAVAEAAANEPGTDDQGLIDRLVAHGASDLMARRVVVLGPIALGRAVLEPLGVTTSPDLVIDDRGLRNTVALASFAEYRVCRAVAADPTLNRFPGLATWGAEFAAVNRIMNDGSRPDDIVLSTVVTPWDIR